MIKFIFELDDSSIVNCIGWDGYNGEDNTCLGCITKNNDDGYFWFFPACEQVPLTANQLSLISTKLKALNK